MPNPSGWNYRVVHVVGETENDNYYDIHEVYYGDNEPNGLTEQAVQPGGESREEFADAVRTYLKALTRPVLVYSKILGRFIGEEPPIL